MIAVSHDYIKRNFVTTRNANAVPWRHGLWRPTAERSETVNIDRYIWQIVVGHKYVRFLVERQSIGFVRL